MKSLPKNTHRVDWFSAILLIICMQIAAGRLVATHWTEDLHLVQVIALFGTILGLALGKSIFKRFWVVFLAIAYGMIVIPWQIGLILESEIEWRIRLLNLLGRLGVVINELIAKKAVTDNLLFLLLMAILFWSLSVYAGFILVRSGNPWKVVIPGGIAALVIHSFDPLLLSRTWYLAFYLFFALLLVARLIYLQNIAAWRLSHTHTPPDLGFDLTRATLLLVMILVFFAWTVPVLAQTFKPVAQIWQTASRPWLSTKDRFGFMFASLRASVGLVQDYFGNTLALGLGSPLSDSVVLEVEAPSSLPNDYRFYWEARTYNLYKDNQWTSDLRTAHQLSAESLDLNQPGVDVRPVVTTTFFPHVPISTLYTVSEPLWVNRSTQVFMAINPDGLVNYGSMMGKGFVHPGEQYTMRSAVDAVTEAELRLSGSDYPQWVLDSYLQVPESITPRTKALAREIASGLSNPYDMVKATTEYLRNNIEYNQSINQPPPNQERIDWFLFDYRKGFCNYYASAEVVLLRSMGIPARMAVGFAQGVRKIPPIEGLPPGAGSVVVPQEQVSETATYVVRQKDAHAWPEIYFPGIGWVIFEPTVSQPELFRPSGEVNPSPEQDQPLPGNDNNQDQQELNNPDRQVPDVTMDFNASTDQNYWTFTNILKIAFLIFALGILALVVWQVKRGFRVLPFFTRMSIEIPVEFEKGLRKIGIQPPDFLVNWIYYLKLPAISRSYLEINRALKRIGQKTSIQETPLERKDALIRSIPEAKTSAERLLFEYQTYIYSPHDANLEIAQKAGAEIRNLSWLARFAKILKRFQEPDQRS